MMTAVVLFMRSALLYLVAAFAPIVWASSVSPIMRGSGRRLVHVTVALVLAKPAITVTLVVGTKLLAHAGAPGGRGARDPTAQRRSARWSPGSLASQSPGCRRGSCTGCCHRSTGVGRVGGRRRLGARRDDRCAGGPDGEVPRCSSP
jgi:hypothetical protein